MIVRHQCVVGTGLRGDRHLPAWPVFYVRSKNICGGNRWALLHRTFAGSTDTVWTRRDNIFVYLACEFLHTGGFCEGGRHSMGTAHGNCTAYSQRLLPTLLPPSVHPSNATMLDISRQIRTN